MESKKSFGNFLQAKRIEKGFTQKQMAESLFVTESAVSKWERGITYPDITLVSKICELLGISEKELLTASEDTQGEKIAKEAKKYSVIVNVYKGIFGIGYALALLTCFIVNIAVEHKLTWFFVVLAAIMIAFSLTLLPILVKKNKALITLGAFTVSLIFLLVICYVYSGGGNWLIITLTSIIFGLSLVFLPFILKVVLRDTAMYKHKTLLYFIVNSLLLFILLFICNLYTGGNWFFSKALPAAAVSLLLPWGIMVVIRYFKINAFFKTSICCALSAVFYGFINSFYATLFGGNENNISLFDVSKQWPLLMQGHASATFVSFVAIFSTFVAACIIFAIVGIVKQVKKK